jgi:hypothetical protein
MFQITPWHVDFWVVSDVQYVTQHILWKYMKTKQKWKKTQLFSEDVIAVEDYISISVDLQGNNGLCKSNTAYKKYIIQHHTQPPKTQNTYVTLHCLHTASI